MPETTIDPLALQLAVIDALQAILPDDYRAEHFHSGGGIFGVQIETPAGAFLFTTLDVEGAAAWLGVDVCEASGECVANAQVFARPLNGTHGDPDEAAVMASALADLARIVR